MATVVFFHAHPDDEVISTGGTMMHAKEIGHRVVLVCATDGALGEVAEGFLGHGESLADRRAGELLAAADILGIDRVEMLGFADSGMEGESTNDNPDCFWQADVETAAARVAEVLREEAAALLTCYDDHGTYGHPDHVQVHRVGHRAAAIAGLDRVFEATVNRDEMMRQIESDEFGMVGTPEEVEAQRQEFRESKLGVAAERITHAVDVSAYADRKRAALAAHASQVPDDSFFLVMPPEGFVAAFGTEWYTEVGAPRATGAPFGADILTGLG